MNAVVQFQPPRLPYHPLIEERFGIDKTAWKALVEAVYPSAKTPDAVVMALSYCKARKLDPFKRPVHIVPVWDSKRNDYVETVWPGISELRTTAMRTGLYAGCDETAFGPELGEEFTWTDRRNQTHKAKVVFPEWAQCTIYRLINGTRVPVVGPKVYWTETYASMGKQTAPNDMWRKRPRGQLEKCAEAAALRRAFPEELGNEYAAEEMEGKPLGPVETLQALKTEPRKLHAEFEEVDPAEAEATAQLDAILDGDAIPPHDLETGEIIDAEVEAEDNAEATDDAPEVTAGPSEAELPAGLADADFDHVEWSGAFVRNLENLHTVDEVNAAWNEARSKGFVFKVKAKSPELAKQLADACTARVAAIKAAAEGAAG